MIFDTDDLYDGNDRLDLLQRLKDVNPAFRMTAFCVPRLGDDFYWDSLPEWIECVGHGEYHPDPREAEHWTYEKAMDVLLSLPPRFVDGWKSPGWQISDGTYLALVDLGWWVADHPESAGRRPDGIRYHELGQGDHVHTHVQDVCGNGLSETFASLLEKVERAESFELISEVVQPWVAA